MIPRKIVVTSKHTAHYIAFGEQGWLWVRNYADAKVFASKDEAETFVRTWLPGMVNDVWYLGG